MPPAAPRRRLGLALVVGGILVIVASVLFVLERANGPGSGPTTFAARRGYDQVKAEVHKVFPYALLTGLAGLGLALYGGRLLERESEGDTEPR